MRSMAIVMGQIIGKRRFRAFELAQGAPHLPSTNLVIHRIGGHQDRFVEDIQATQLADAHRDVPHANGMLPAHTER